MSQENNQGLTYLLQGIETFIAMNGRITKDYFPRGASAITFDMSNHKVAVEIHGQSFREYQPVITYDSRLGQDDARVAVARQLILLAPDHWSLVGRQLGNASERGRTLDTYARSVAENGGRKHLDTLLALHVLND